MPFQPKSLTSLVLATAFLASKIAYAVPVWGQCGGINHTGSTECESGTTCVYVNDWYFQCQPGSSVPTTTAGTTTTASTTAGPNPTSTAFTDYLFVYFTGEGKSNGEQIYMSVSNNNNPGSWTAVKNNQPILTTSVGTQGVRDPSIIRGQNGKFWIIATDLKVYGNGNYNTETGSKSIVVWESSNLKNWSGPYLRQISPSNAGMTWAPDAIWDPAKSQYLVHWTCNLKGDGWYIMKSYTSDFITFSTAEKFLSGAGMDVTIIYDKSTSTYYRISKNGPNELIEEARASSLSNSGWTVVKNQIGLNAMPKGEGPLIFQNNQNPNKWHLFIDNYTRGSGYLPFETTSISTGNWVTSSGFSLPSGNRHGYVIGITAEERAMILQA